MEKSYVTQWHDVGHKICAGFSDRLDDHATGINYSLYFHAVYFFDGDNGTGPVPDNVINFCLQVLSKRRSSISSSNPLKNLLGEFISISSIIFATQQTRKEALQMMKKEKLLPNVVKELGNNAAFVEERYDETIKERIGAPKDKINAWQRLNWKVMAIGEWINDKREAASLIFTFLAGATVAIPAIIGVVTTFINEGIFWGILALVIIGFLGYWGTIIAAFIGSIFCNIIMYVLRLIFYNIYTLILTTILILYGFFAPLITTILH